jgi:3-oxoacyl-[acyl-carrier-protein] synthase II
MTDQLTCGELVPGDVLIVDGADHFAVLDASPADEQTVRLTLRAVHGGPRFHALRRRRETVRVAAERVDPACVPRHVPSSADVEFRAGDRMRVIHASRPEGEERHYVRRDAAWFALDGSEAPFDDDRMRALMTRDPKALICRHDPVSRRPRRVVVTGVGAVTPLGGDAAATWQGLLEGRSGVRELDGERFAALDVRVGAPAAVDPTGRLPRSRARKMSRSAQFASVAAQEAWADAGFAPGEAREGGLDDRRVGVSIGSVLGGTTPGLVDAHEVMTERGPGRVSPHTAPMLVPNGAAAQVAIDLGARCEARTVVSACASGTESIGLAIERIRNGHADVMVAGGAEAIITPTLMASFAAMRALSRGAHGPEKASRPFDAGRDGFVVGEGAGLLVLESEEHARARGARVYCEAAGWGVSSDAHDMVRPRADGAGVADALRKALADACAEPGDVVNVNAHATATSAGDAAEALALRTVFGEGRVPPVTAPKGAMGHLQGAAGGVEAIATVLALHHGVIPPTVNCEDPDEGLGLDVVTGPPRPLPEDGDLVLSNSFGFGGHNAVLALRRAA